MRILSLVFVTVLVVGATAPAAQERPTFAGRWTTDPDPAAASAPVVGAATWAAGGESTITITQDAKSLTVECAFFARGDMQPPLKFVYALDGSETKNSLMMGRGIQTQTSRTAWTAATLVITTTHTLPDPVTGKPTTTDVTQKLTLESATSLVVETTRAGVAGEPASTTRTVYRKLG